MKAIVAVALLAAACGPVAVAPPPTPPPAETSAGTPGDAPTAFTAMERQLLDAPVVQIEITTEASGAHTAELGGKLIIAAGNKVRLDVHGTLDGKEVELHYASNGSAMSDGTFTPSHLGEAFLIGFTRMGALHNIALLAMGGRMEHTSGDVGDWVRAVDVGWLPIKRTVPPTRALMFDLDVGGARAGSARLWIDEHDLPYKRLLTVHFGDADMEVEEHYHIEIGGELPADTFDVHL